MNKTRIIILYIFFSLFVSCKTSKKVYEKRVEIVKDSTNRTLQLATKNELIITNICDSLGNAKEFTNVVDSGTNSTEISVKNNKLTVKAKGDSIIYVDRFRHRHRVEIDEKIIEKTRTVWPKWLLLGWIISLIVLIFPNISRLVNTAIRKIFL